MSDRDPAVDPDGTATSDPAESAAVVTPCIGNDPTCPCRDGDACHYRTYGNSPGWPARPEHAVRSAPERRG